MMTLLATVGLESAFSMLFSAQGFFLMILGTTLGITVGAIPGLTGAMLIALTLPLTFTMDSGSAMMLLVSMYVGSVSGGLITATLLRIPGTPSAMMTTLDGYPMAQKGQSGRALGLGISASFVGGMISLVFLILLSEPLSKYATHLGPFEFFSLVLMALVLIASVGGRSISRSLFAGFLGIFFAMPGIVAATGEVRMTFGITELNGGFKLLPMLIGLFAISQIVTDVLEKDKEVKPIQLSTEGMFMNRKEWLSQMGNMIRSSCIGTWIGVLPGIGANIGSVAAYSTAKNFSKTPEKFGHGSEEGIVAAESANNATVGGALIPLITMGIPGSVIDAILLGALMIHQLQPGPLLFEQNPEVVYTIIGSFSLANIFMLFIMILLVKPLSKLSSIPKMYLIVTVLAFCVIGTYAQNNNMFDVWSMLGFGLLGFALERFSIPLAPFVIGFVLGPMAESKLSTGLMSSHGSWLPLVSRPVSCFFVIISIILLVLPMIQRFKKVDDV
ncbi:MAG: tripartite tricarboxylate transporter permease [Lentisphaeraceae bacterium]|nr:tripartite tricarboxylate transporter permease [Lentisphaeraceae bacterium]